MDETQQRIASLERDTRELAKQVTRVNERMDELIEQQRMAYEVITKWKGLGGAVFVLSSLFWAAGQSVYQWLSQGQ